MTAPQQLLGPDGKTPLRRYAGYNGGGPGFGGQLIDWNAPQQSADAALLPNFIAVTREQTISFAITASRRTPCSCTRIISSAICLS